MKKTIILFGISLLISTLSAQTNGGPDPYGYTWKNVDHSTSPPAFVWKDIVSIGTQVTSGLGDDTYAGPFSMGGNFQFYWYTRSQFYIGSNGYLSFPGENISSAFPASIPLSSGGNDFIAPFMADLNFVGSGNPAKVYYWSNTDSLVVSFVEVPFWDVTTGYTGSNTFQVIMNKSDYSITFNYLDMNLGAKTGLDNLVGIENVSGTLGLAALIDSFPRDSFAIKFYRPPSSSYQAIDGSMIWNFNIDNAGTFVKAGGKKSPLSANFGNLGNTNLSSFTVHDTVYAGSSVISSGSRSVSATIAPGNDTTLFFNDSLPPMQEGIYKFRTHITGITGDVVPTNDFIEQEMVAVDTTDANIWLGYSDGQPDQTGLGWNGGNGGIAVYIEPPIYPAEIDRTRFYITQNTNTVGFHALIYDDDGPNGTHGTLLDSVYVPPADITLNQWTGVNTSTEVVVQNGGVYLLWLMDGAGIDLGRDFTPPFSRRSYEVLSGAWSGYRRLKTEDFLLDMRIQYAYPKADFNFFNVQDPQINFFDNSSRNPTTWFWDFGDGDTAWTQNPTHTYEWNGNYNVCLAVSNQWGSDTICKTVLVAAIPAVAKFVYDDANLPTVAYTDSSTGPPTNWSWNFDEPGTSDTSSQQNPTYTFNVHGVHNVCLTVSNANGISDPYCLEIPFAVGIDDADWVDLKIYPNPVSTTATIELPESLKRKRIDLRIFSIDGRSVESNFERNGDLVIVNKGNLSKGPYIIEILADDKTISRVPIQIQ